MALQMTRPTSSSMTKYGSLIYFADVDADPHPYGSAAQAEIGFLAQYLRNGDTVVDIGANTGFQALGFADHVAPSGKVYAFEQDGFTRTVLITNIATSGLSHVEVRKFDWRTPTEDDGGNLPDDLMIRDVLDRVSFMRLNFPHRSAQIIRAFRKKIAACHPTIFCSDPSMSSIYQSFLFLERIGYSAFFIHTTADGAGCEENVTALSEGSRSGVLFLPPGKPFGLRKDARVQCTTITSVSDIIDSLLKPVASSWSVAEENRRFLADRMTRLEFQVIEADARARLALSRADQTAFDEAAKIEVVKAKFSRQLRKRDDLIRAIYASTSWKAAWPVRAVTATIEAAHVRALRVISIVRDRVRHAERAHVGTPAGEEVTSARVVRRRADPSSDSSSAKRPDPRLDHGPGAPFAVPSAPSVGGAPNAQECSSGFESVFAAAKGSILFITLGRGGGAERHVREMQEALEAEGVSVFVLRSSPNHKGILKLDASGLGAVPDIHVPRDVALLKEMIEQLGIRHIHVQHLADAGAGAEHMIQEAARAVGIAYDVTIHDYMFVCPRFTLIGQSGIYCGEPGPSSCNTCMASFGLGDQDGSIEKWRGRYDRLLRGARKTFVPNSDVVRRMQAHFPEVDFTIRPHFAALGPLRPVSKVSDGIRKIAVLGAIRPHKGSKLLLDCAKYAAERSLPLKFIVIGFTSVDDELRALPNVTITGPYEENDLGRLIAEHAPEIVWFTSVGPETFSYTFSTAVEMGLFPVSVDLGAIAERIKTLGWGAIMPLKFMLSAEKIVDFLESVEISTHPGHLARSINVSYPSILSDYYSLSFP